MVDCCSPTGSTVVGPPGNPGTPGTPALITPLPAGRKREISRLTKIDNHVLFIVYHTKSIDEAQNSLEIIKKLILPKVCL